MIDVDDEPAHVDDAIKDITEDFLLDLEILFQDFGKEKIIGILQSTQPGLFDEATLTSIIPPASLSENIFLTEKKGAPAAPEDWCNKIPRKFTKTRMMCTAAGWSKDVIMNFLGFGAGAALGLGKEYVSKEWDQDINIAAQTGPPLKIDVSSLENLIGNTNLLLQNMMDAMKISSKELDNSIDFAAASLTGDTMANVQGAQATGGTPTLPREPSSAGADTDDASPVAKAKKKAKKEKSKK